MATLLEYLHQKLLPGNQMKPEVSEQEPASITVPGLTLYYSPFCGYCMRVFSALQMMQLEIATRNVMSDREAATELRQEGGSGMVPCLRIEEGSTIRWMYESADIIDYLRQYEPKT
jgi:glutathione S-transferase